jgi:hypothetical protein
LRRQAQTRVSDAQRRLIGEICHRIIMLTSTYRVN